MEKIKVSKLSETDGDIFYRLASKINEIIDEFHTINVQKVTIDRLVEEDRLITLEDKIEFIMKNTAWDTKHTIRDDTNKLSLQDLWDEQHWDRLEAIKKVYTQEAKEEACNCSDDDMCKCKRQIIKPSVNQIEEIISGTKDYLSCVDEDNCTGADNCECLYHKFESWLRDKLKSL